MKMIFAHDEKVAIRDLAPGGRNAIYKTKNEIATYLIENSDMLECQLLLTYLPFTSEIGLGCKQNFIKLNPIHIEIVVDKKISEFLDKQ